MVIEKANVDLLVMLYGQRNHSNQDGRDLHIENIRYLRFGHDPNESETESEGIIITVAYESSGHL